jgi:hypothetical protein
LEIFTFLRLFHEGRSAGKLKAGEDYILRNFVNCTSPNIIRLIKSRRMRWAVDVTGTDTRDAQNIFIAKSEGKRPLG